MYGAQTRTIGNTTAPMFENDVEMYGAQTIANGIPDDVLFENDVEMYGAQTYQVHLQLLSCLRMM